MQENEIKGGDLSTRVHDNGEMPNLVYLTQGDYRSTQLVEPTIFQPKGSCEEESDVMITVTKLRQEAVCKVTSEMF